ncbi:MAG TPA: UdgX family uracil-DNA binding protein [Vicinamibacteria bacterium]|jgi:uracil-DNA glycosylase family protein|nr:UdgX family uracil-DNA binding protein [Vicinamibacteria bacterium]
MAETRRQVRVQRTFESWQAAARDLLQQEVPPEAVEWRDSALTGSLFASATEPAAGAFRVPRRFVELARAVVPAGPEACAALYKVLWRIVRENHDLLRLESDPDVARLIAMEREGPAAAESAAPFVPSERSLESLRAAAAACRGCELYRYATRTVFGVGPETARVVLVGEQPGDQEDLQGAPFVGPAGQVLDRALAEAGLARDQVYLTNAVKHFKFVQRGKRRIHETPRDREILACQPWLEAELGLLKPDVLVSLGATASRALFGPWFRLMQQRGEFLPTRWSRRTLATLHPSAVLRAQDDESQQRLYGLLKTDLGAVAGALVERPVSDSRA